MFRLFVKNLTDNLTADQVHYVQHVIKCKPGSHILAFNETGEWLCCVHIEKRKIRLEVLNQTREPSAARGIILAVPAIRPKRFAWMVEKTTELDIKEIRIIKTEFSQPYTLDLERLERIAIEAAEQCGRLSIPKIYEAVPLKSLFTLNIKWGYGSCKPCPPMQGHCEGIIIGPEGGFSDAEISLLEQHAIPISFGNNILRTETAACVAATCTAIF